jgi:hypothetical protein
MNETHQLTVGELIDILLRMPQDAKVFQESDYGRHYCEAVSFDDKANEVTLIPG